MKSLIIVFSFLVSTEIRLSLCVDGTESQDAEVIPPMTANEIRKTAIAERDGAVKNAKLAFNNAMAEIDVIKREAEEVRDEKLKFAKVQTKRANIIASTIRRSALREHAKRLKDARNEYAQVFEEAKKNAEKLSEESNSLVEATEDEFVKKYAEIKESKKKIENENRELLEKVRKEIEAEKQSALDRRGQAVKEYRLGLRNKNASAEERNSLLPIYEEELGTYEKTIESLDEKWQKTLDDIGIGKEYETSLENALIELEEGGKKANLGARDARKECAQAAIDARKALDEKQASANAGRVRAETEAREILEADQIHRNEMLEKSNKKYEQLQKLIEAEVDSANIKMRAAIGEASKEYEKALQKAKETELKEKKTRLTNKNL